MTHVVPRHVDGLVLILAPLGRDAIVIEQVLAPLPLRAVICADLDDVVDRMDENATVAVLTEESLRHGGAARLQRWIEEQPAWSDFPFVVLANRQGGRRTRQARDALASLGNEVLLERPLNADTLISAVNSARRSRGRQHEARRHLRQQETVGAENRRLYESERAARSDADDANRAKDEFLATLSHELRTPLSAILGWVNILKRRKSELGDLARGVETIERNALAQARLIDDLLDMSRIVAGKISLECQVVNPAGLVQQVVASALPGSDAKHIRIEQQVDAALPCIEGDPQRLQQVLWNLLTNAIKFTPDGGTIRMGACVAGDQLALSVTDSGAGIAADFLPHVFDRFRQADGSTTRAHGGLGLGLAIVRKLVEMHGGTVEASSAGLGAGATFTVRLPLSARSTESPATPRDGDASREPATVADPRIEGLRVLVVDDDQDGRDMLAQVLTEAGGDVQSVPSAAAALEAVEEERFDVMVSDIGMPDMDGYELMARLRREGHRLPALALTAFVRTQDRERALAAGYQMHLGKPVDAVALLSAIREVASAM